MLEPREEKSITVHFIANRTVGIFWDSGLTWRSLVVGRLSKIKANEILFNYSTLQFNPSSNIFREKKMCIEWSIPRLSDPRQPCMF